MSEAELLQRLRAEWRLFEQRGPVLFAERRPTPMRPPVWSQAWWTQRRTR